MINFGFAQSSTANNKVAQQAQALLNNGNKTGAKMLLESHSQKHPEDRESLLILLGLYESEYRVEALPELFEKLIAFSPDEEYESRNEKLFEMVYKTVSRRYRSAPENDVQAWRQLCRAAIFRGQYFDKDTDLAQWKTEWQPLCKIVVAKGENLSAAEWELVTTAGTPIVLDYLFHNSDVSSFFVKSMLNFHKDRLTAYIAKLDNATPQELKFLSKTVCAVAFTHANRLVQDQDMSALMIVPGLVQDVDWSVVTNCPVCAVMLAEHDTWQTYKTFSPQQKLEATHRLFASGKDIFVPAGNVANSVALRLTENYPASVISRNVACPETENLIRAMERDIGVLLQTDRAAVKTRFVDIKSRIERFQCLDLEKSLQALQKLYEKEYVAYIQLLQAQQKIETSNLEFLMTIHTDLLKQNYQGKSELVNHTYRQVVAQAAGKIAQLQMEKRRRDEQIKQQQRVNIVHVVRDYFESMNNDSKLRGLWDNSSISDPIIVVGLVNVEIPRDVDIKVDGNRASLVLDIEYVIEGQHLDGQVEVTLRRSDSNWKVHNIEMK